MPLAAAAKHAYDSQKALAGDFTPADAFDGPRKVRLARGHGSARSGCGTLPDT